MNSRRYATVLAVALVLVAILLGVFNRDFQGNAREATDGRNKGDQTAAAPPNPDREHSGEVTVDVVGDSGKPVAAAEVVLTDSVTAEHSSQTTGEDGGCTFSSLFPGAYVVQAKKDGLESDSRNLKVKNNQNTTVRLVLKPKR
jgi:Carboxypeptidase regulatory-like domain